MSCCSTGAGLSDYMQMYHQFPLVSNWPMTLVHMFICILVAMVKQCNISETIAAHLPFLCIGSLCMFVCL